jgi:hypothetical protein
MAWQKKIKSILIEFKKGRLDKADMASLMELLDKQPSAVPEVIGELTGILKSENTTAYSSAITALNMLAEMEPDQVAGSLDAILGCIRRGEKEFHEDWFLGSLDILIKISQKYPERMDIAVSDLLLCLENISAAVREKSYFLLALLAVMRPEVFMGHSKELVRVLQGLNIDERIYACKLIKKIAESNDPKIVESTYDVLEDLRLNHLDSNLRSEAAYAADKIRVKENIIKQNSSRCTVNLAKSGEDNTSDLARYHVKDGCEYLDIDVSEFANLLAPNEEDIKYILRELGFNHLISKK